jgi:hypothetical protein
MNRKVLILALPVVSLLSGCSSFSEPERPSAAAKPVVSKKSTGPAKPASKKVNPPVAKKVPETSPGTATYAIEEPSTQFKVEPSIPVLPVQPLVAPPETPTIPGTSMVPTAPAVSALPSSGLTLPSSQMPSVTTLPPAQTLPAYVLEDVRVPDGTSPAVLALLSDADRSRGAGDLDTAVIALERALRIDSRNPTLTYKLAQLRIKQNKPQLAEEMAGKAALLAGGDLELKRKSWMMIAEARRLQQNLQGAKEAKAKAESFFGH